MKNLVIVESPTKARLVGRYAKPVLGEVVTRACFGHLRDLPEGELGIDVANDFFPKYEIIASRKNIIEELRPQVRKAETIYLAPDPDREGEAVAWHVYHVFKPELKGKKLHRVFFREITEKAVQHSLKNPRQLDLALVQAAVSRRVMDRMVGYIISPKLWKGVKGKDLSAGRVQTAALRLLVEQKSSEVSVEFEL